MTRSGLASATLWATCTNGHSAGLLQSWNLPRSSSSAAALPPLAAGFRGLEAAAGVAECGDRLQGGLGQGSGKFSTLAEVTPAGIGRSHTRTGKRGVGERANVHRLLRAVDGDGGASARLRQHRACHRTPRTEHHIGRFELGRLRVGGPRRTTKSPAQARTPRACSPIGPFAQAQPRPCDVSPFDRDPNLTRAERTRGDRRRVSHRQRSMSVEALPIKRKRPPQGRPPSTRQARLNVSANRTRPPDAAPSARGRAPR